MQWLLFKVWHYCFCLLLYNYKSAFSWGFSPNLVPFTADYKMCLINWCLQWPVNFSFFVLWSFVESCLTCNQTTYPHFHFVHTNLKIEFILAFGSWNFRNTRKTLMSMSGLGHLKTERYHSCCTISVISNTWKQHKFCNITADELHVKKHQQDQF